MEWATVENYVNDPDIIPVIVGISGGILLLILVFAYYKLRNLYKRMKGLRAMKKRAKLSKEVQEIIEDHVVCAFSEAIASKRITLDEARVLYARWAHLGLWGLHPRKFVPKKTPLDLAELKEQLKAKRAARTASNIDSSNALEKMLEGID